MSGGIRGLFNELFGTDRPDAAAPAAAAKAAAEDFGDDGIVAVRWSSASDDGSAAPGEGGSADSARVSRGYVRPAEPVPTVDDAAVGCATAVGGDVAVGRGVTAIGNAAAVDKSAASRDTAVIDEAANITTGATANINSGDAVIGSDVSVSGPLSVKGGFRLAGTLHGDLAATGDVYISGLVDGNVTAPNATLAAGGLRGNIICEKSITTGAGCAIIGDLTAEIVRAGGQVKGNIKAAEVALYGSAVIEGDITAQSLEIEEGASVLGAIRISV